MTQNFEDFQKLTPSNTDNSYIYHKKPTLCLSLHELKIKCYQPLSESLSSFLPWKGMPSKRTMLLTETRENPLLTEAFAPKKVETSTQPGEILVFLPMSRHSQNLHAHSRSRDVPLKKK